MRKINSNFTELFNFRFLVKNSRPGVGTGIPIPWDPSPNPKFWDWDWDWDRFFRILGLGLGLGSIFQNFGIGIGLGITNSGQNPKKSQESQEIPKVVVEISVNLISMNYLLFFFELKFLIVNPCSSVLEALSSNANS